MKVPFPHYSMSFELSGLRLILHCYYYSLDVGVSVRMYQGLFVQSFELKGLSLHNYCNSLDLDGSVEGVLTEGFAFVSS